jgi:hypothetical protein
MLGLTRQTMPSLSVNHHMRQHWSARLPGLARRQGKVAAYGCSRLCFVARGPPRVHSPAFSRPSGVNRDTKGPLGTRGNTTGPRQTTRIRPVKTGFALHRFGGAGEAADCLSTATHRHRGLRTLRDQAIHRCGASRRNRISSPTLVPQRGTVAGAKRVDAPDSSPTARHCCRAKRARVDSSPTARHCCWR